MAAPTVAVVLPPREGFGHGRTGALGLLAWRLTRTPGFRTVVYGGRQDGPVFPGITFHPVTPSLWPPANANIRYAAAIAGALRRQPPAWIEVHNRPEIALALAARLPAVPVSLILNNDPQGMREIAKPAARGKLLRRLALVITCSDYIRQRVIDGVANPAKQPVLLHNCFDLAELPPPVRREPLILFTGRVVREKAPDAFVSACALALPFLDNWRAAIIGADRFHADSPDTAFVQRIRGAAEAAGVQMLGYHDHPSVLAAMARAAIVVVPSRWPEPFGLVALEALASGAALISSGRGGLREVSGEAAVYADPDDPAALAAAIKGLALDDARRMALAAAGRVQAARFDAPVIAAQLAGVRRQAMAAFAAARG